MDHSLSKENKAILTSAEAKRIEKTPEFMRLEQLKQLGCARFVFPGANHCRDEHSIAVAHKACCVGQHLGASTEDLMLLEVAGLCHDLGHGPFSHVFEHLILPRLGITRWSHVKMSAKLLWHINRKHQVGLTEEQLLRITDIINGEGGSGLDWTGREWMLQVVASTVDVDRIDYLIRDWERARHDSPPDLTRLLQGCQVLPDKSGKLQICFHESQQPLLEEMFAARYAMHRAVYQHHAVKAVEMMVADVIALADPVMQFSQLIYEPEDFLALTDGVLDHIRYRIRLLSKEQQQQQQCGGSVASGSQQWEALSAAQEVLECIDMSRFYLCVSELQPKQPNDGRFSDLVKDLRAADLAVLCDGQLTDSDIRVVPVAFDHGGRQDQDPMAAVTLYDDCGHTFKSRFSQPPAAGFRTQLLRVYLTKDFKTDTVSKEKAVKSLQDAVDKLVGQCFMKSNGSSSRSSSSNCSSQEVVITHPCVDEAAAAEVFTHNGMAGQARPANQVMQVCTPAAVAYHSLSALGQSPHTCVPQLQQNNEQQLEQQPVPFQGYALQTGSGHKRRCLQCGPDGRQTSAAAEDEQAAAAAQQVLLLGDDEVADGDGVSLLLSQLSQNDVVMLEQQ